MNKRLFGQNKNEVSEKTISKQGIAPISDKIAKVFCNLILSTSAKLVQRYKGFVNFYKQYIQRLAKKLIPLYQFLRREIKIQHHGTDTSTDTDYFIHFVAKSFSHHTVMKQVSSQGESSVIYAQPKDPEIQRMIPFYRDSEFPPNYVTFENRFFQKLFKNRSVLEITKNNLYRKYFDQKSEVTSQQIVGSDNIVDEIIGTMHDNPMPGHPNSSKMLNELPKHFYAST